MGRRPPACAESLCTAPMCRSGSLHHFKPSQAPGTKVTLPRAQGLSGSGTGDIALNTGRVLAVPFQPGRGGPGGQRVGQEPWPAQGLAPGGCVVHKMEHCLQPGERGRRTVQSVPLATAQGKASSQPGPEPGSEWAGAEGPLRASPTNTRCLYLLCSGRGSLGPGVGAVGGGPGEVSI